MPAGQVMNLIGICPQVLIHGQAPTQPLNQGLDGNDREETAQTEYSGRPQGTPLHRVSGNMREHGSTPTSSWSTGEQGGAYPKNRAGFFNRQYSFGRDDISHPSELDKDDHSLPTPKTERPYYNRAEQRTIIAQNLADRTTHKDIVNIVRGGPLLDVFLRMNERSASISFVEGSAAQEFMNYVKRNDIYIHGKRVSISKLSKTCPCLA